MKHASYRIPGTILLIGLLFSLAVLVQARSQYFIEGLGLVIIGWIMIGRHLTKSFQDSRALRETVEQLHETVERWASGELQARVYLDHEDPLVDLAQGMNAVAAVLQERTEDLIQDKERLEAILSSMANGIIILNHGLTITLINRAAIELFGMDEMKPQGRHFMELIRDVSIIDAVEYVTRRGGTRTVTWNPPDNENYALEVTITAISQPVGGLGAVLVARNISSQLQVDRMRQDFVANVSHELQTPLTIIRGFMETLIDDDSDAQTARRFIQLVHDEANRMSRLVDDLLTLSRMEHHSLPIAVGPVDTRVMIESIFAKLMQRRQQQGLIFDDHIPSNLPMVSGDADLLAEVFLNLISNAVQYTPAGGRITVDAVAHTHVVHITVSDTGIGIPAAEIPRIFERFYRVDRARSRASGGTGLGLAIVKHIMELHRGRIEVRSTPGEGTAFTVILPQYVEEGGG